MFLAGLVGLTVPAENASFLSESCHAASCAALAAMGSVVSSGGLPRCRFAGAGPTLVGSGTCSLPLVFVIRPRRRAALLKKIFC